MSRLVSVAVFATILLGVRSAPISKPWLRLDGAISNPRVNTSGSFLAFIDEQGSNLRVLDLKSKDVFLVTPHTVNSAFFWSPDGSRIFYRELSKNQKMEVTSHLRAYDTAKHKHFDIAKYPRLTGTLTYDPRDMKMHFMSASGLHTRRLVLPDQRLARWQIAQRTDNGKWIASENRILWATDGGFKLSPAPDDGSGLQAFDISADGSTIAWSTKAGRVYIAVDGLTNLREIGYGQDPQWHPTKAILVYSGAHMVGDKVSDYDIRVYSLEDGKGKYITSTFDINERWPLWHPNGVDIIFTRKNSTDLFRLELAL